MGRFSNRYRQGLFWGTLSGGFLNAAKAIQIKIAGWLNAKTKGYSFGQWLLLLILFCGFAGSICIYLIVSSIY
ncbi:hypothetical protein HQN86_24870 [Pedobacter panaciterrae]|uniref:hypothetical protein n=1 Tax=Pedobacter panaciterrae TaxID=363849 RepID=UPI00155D98D3|nr:hypothetical protein [Pedobacter panaciterrae]NQX56874.1 hypothetical protein [Pedobacter panaciterrae]